MKTTNQQRLLAAAVALACASSFAAQAADSDNIEKLTVTGSRLDIANIRLAASTTVISEDEIRRSGALQLADLLRSLPGITIAQNGSPGSLAEVRVRGSESNHLLVLIDGVVANDIGQGSILDLAHLTVGSIKQIELLRGPQSALWGSGAIGGVLSITTHASDNNEHASVTVGAGNRDTTQVNLNASGKAGKVRFATYADWFETGGDNVSRNGPEDDGYRNITTGGSIAWQPVDAHQLSFNARLVDYANDYDSTDYVFTGLPADADNMTDGKQISAQANWLFTPANTPWNSNLSLQYREDSNDNTNSGVPAGSTKGTRLQTTWVNRYSGDDWQVAGGVEWLQRLFEQRGDASFGDPNQDQHDTTLSAFAEGTTLLAEGLTGTFNARFDNNSEFDDAVSYRAGLNWAATDAFTLFVSQGKAIKTPTFTERFGYYPQSFIGNPDLEPETSTEWEAGVKFQLDRAWQGQISYYDATLENEILGYVYDMDLGAATAQNANSDSDRSGVDAELNWQGDAIAVRATYSYLDAKESNVNELRRAKHTGSLTVSGDLPVQDLSAYLKLAYTGERYDTFYPPYPANPETLELDGYTLVSLNVGYAITAKWQANLRVDNAFDKNYEDIIGYAGEKRRVLASVTYQF